MATYLESLAYKPKKKFLYEKVSRKLTLFME